MPYDGCERDSRLASRVGGAWVVNSDREMERERKKAIGTASMREVRDREWERE